MSFKCGRCGHPTKAGMYYDTDYGFICRHCRNKINSEGGYEAYREKLKKMIKREVK
jgi:transposase-like protein